MQLRAQLEKTISDLRAEIAEKDLKLDNLRQRIGVTVEENMRLKQLLRDKTEEVRCAHEVEKKVDEREQAFKERITSLRADVSHLQYKIEARDYELRSCQERLARASKLLQESGQTQTIEEMQRELESLRETTRRYRKQIEQVLQAVGSDAWSY